MIKSLIATSLLLFATSNKSISYERKNPNRAYEDTVTLHGQYVLRDDFEPYIQAFIESHTNGYYDFNYTAESALDGIKATFNYNSIWYIGNIVTLYVALDITDTYSDTSLYFNYDVDDDGTGITWEITDEPITYYETLNDLADSLDSTAEQNSAKNQCLWVQNYYTITKEAWEVFNCFYTMSGNYYMTAYNGYYTFVNAWTKMNNINYWKWPIQFLADNVLYNEIGCWDEHFNRLYAYMETTYDETVEKNIYTDISAGMDTNRTGYNIKNNQVWINGFIPTWLKSKMDSVGIFGYVQPVQQEYSFFEFFAGIMDAPIVMISGLLDFELFGVYAFTALAGLMTVLLIVAIIKKVI